MPIFAIERDFSGWTEADLESAQIRAEVCALHFSGLRWVRSFIHADLGGSVCIYEGASEADVREHARLAKMPCGQIREVSELLPDLDAEDDAEDDAEEDAEDEATG